MRLQKTSSCPEGSQKT